MLKEILQNKFVAYLLFELPGIDVLKGFDKKTLANLNENSQKVHMIGKDGYLGKTMGKNLLSFIKLNSETNFYFWYDNSLAYLEDEFDIASIWPNLTGIMRADILRLLIIYNYGGIYFDLKSSFNSSLLKIDSQKSYLVYEDNYLEDGQSIVANWFLAFPAKHPFIKKCLKKALVRYKTADIKSFSEYADYVKYVSGPLMITSCYYENQNLVDYVIKHDSKVFNPRYMSQGAWVRMVINQHYSSKSFKR